MYLFAWELLVFLIQDTPHSNILSCRVYLVTCPSLADKNSFALKTIPKSVLRDAEHRRHSMAGKESLLKYKTLETAHFQREIFILPWTASSSSSCTAPSRTQMTCT